MTFRRAVQQTPPIAQRFFRGIQALTAVDRGRLRYADPQILRGSVNLDLALRESYPQDPRWDYAIGICMNPGKDSVLWLEVHPASSSHIDEVLRKLQWLKRWVNASAPARQHLPSEFRWVASGKVSFRRGSQEEKRLAQKGLRFPTRQLDLDSLLA